MVKQAIVEPITTKASELYVTTDATSQSVVTNVESMVVSIEYKIIAISTFACFPQIIIEELNLEKVGSS